MKKSEKIRIMLRLDKIGELQRRTVRWYVHDLGEAKLVNISGERMILELDVSYFDIKRIRADKVCYFYLKNADEPELDQDSRHRLSWKKLDLGEDLLVNGSKVEIYTALY